MARHKHRAVASTEPDEAFPEPVGQARLRSEGVVAGPFRLSGLCRTDKGWAVAVVEVDADGNTLSMEIGPSQVFPEIVAQKLVRQQMSLNQETLKRYPWRP